MDSYQINYSEEAVQDLQEIFEYISVDLMEPQTARSQVKRIREKIRSLDVFPERCKAVDWEPWDKQGIRQMPVDNFVVYFLIYDKEKAVQIVRIFYGKRDIPNVIERAT